MNMRIVLQPKQFNAWMVICALSCTGFAHAQSPTKPAVAKPASSSSALSGIGGNSKDPIKIDADKLEVFDKENKAMFSGNVIAVQGDSTMRCATLTVFYEQTKGQTGGPATRSTGTTGQNDSSIRKIDCNGPVTVASKTQTATGDHAVFDRVANKVVLTGNVALSDGANVTRGERIIYDMNSGVANVETNPGGRVRALFVPGSQNAGETQKPNR
jgi:lipopolysaccharide export system protein LptA